MFLRKPALRAKTGIFRFLFSMPRRTKANRKIRLNRIGDCCILANYMTDNHYP
jgi:hypothetical protein